MDCASSSRSGWVLEPHGVNQNDRKYAMNRVPLKPGIPVILGRNPTTGIKKDMMMLSRNQVIVELDSKQARCIVTQVSKQLRSRVDGVEIGPPGSKKVVKPGMILQLLPPPTHLRYQLCAPAESPNRNNEATSCKTTQSVEIGASPSHKRKHKTDSIMESAIAAGIASAAAPVAKRLKFEVCKASTSSRPLGALVGIGTMPLGVQYPDPTRVPTRSQAINMLHCAIDMGVDLIDTADTYSPNCKEPHYVEEIIADALASYTGSNNTSRIIVATKGGMIRIRDDSNGWRLASMDYESTKATIRRSHKALGGQKPIPLWQLHHVPTTGNDWMIKFRSIMEAAKACIDEGLVERVGLCNASVRHVQLAQSIVPIFSVQNRFSIWDKGAAKPLPPEHLPSCQKGMLEYCTDNNIHFFPHGALGGLKARRGINTINDAICDIASSKGVSPQHLLLAFYRKKYPCISHICGFRTMAHMQDSVQASTNPIELSTPEINRIAKVARL